MTSIKVELPTGSRLGLEFAGSPPVLKSIGPNSPLLAKGDVPLHWYAQTLIVKDVEYSYIADTASLEELLGNFSDSPRTLVLYKTPLIGPSQVTVTLPVGKETGIELHGFPPVVVHVDERSAFHKTVPEGYVVDRLILPEDDKELSLASGGFTAANVNRALVESAHEEGRILVLKKVTPKGDTVSSSRPFDFGAFTNQSKWTVKRMFGMENKVSSVKKGEAKTLA